MQKEKIAQGFRFGKLKVEEKTEVRKKSYAVWRCLCDCGGEILLSTQEIRSGFITNCGCIPSVKPGSIDIRGQRFGKLIAIEPTDKRADQGSVVWKCKCDCGNEKEVSVRRLKRGKVRSCGCLSKPPLKEYVGERFGRLTILEFAGRSEKNYKRILWRCRCECGKEIVVSQSELQNGDTRSCGCYQKDQTRKSLKLVDGTSVTILESNQNKVRSNNKSGHTGVYGEKKGTWTAFITLKGKKYWLGRYKNKEDAVRARKRAEELHTDFIDEFYSEHIKKMTESNVKFSTENQLLALTDTV